MVGPPHQMLTGPGRTRRERTSFASLLLTSIAIAVAGLLLYGTLTAIAIDERYNPNCSAPPPETDLDREIKRWANHMPGDCQWMAMRSGNITGDYRSAMTLIWNHLYYAHDMIWLVKPEMLKKTIVIEQPVSAAELRDFLRRAEARHPLDHAHDDDSPSSVNLWCQALFLDSACRRVFD